MIHSSIFNNRIVVQTRTKTKSATGITEVWTDLVTLWASILEINDQPVIDMDQNMNMKLLKITLRGIRDYAIADTRFIYKTNIYKPIQAPRFISRSDTPFTTIYCHSVAKL